ncbi:MAG: hypothetical protein CMJ67_01295, partial [Planctomycetaceae bacterium]|nr:hypothetical protein [Planctomycetaceae bacterium]
MSISTSHPKSHLIGIAVATAMSFLGLVSPAEAAEEWRWVVEGTNLVPADGTELGIESRPVPRKEASHGLSLSGRGTPFVVAPRVDGIEGGFPTEAITLEAWVAIDMSTRWGGVLGAIQDNANAETGVLLGYEADRPAFALASTGIDDAD